MAVLPIAAPADLPPAIPLELDRTTDATEKPNELLDGDASEVPTSSGMAGGGRRGSYGNTAIRSRRPTAARSPWQYCHNAAEAPAHHPRLELSTGASLLRDARRVVVFTGPARPPSVAYLPF